MKPEGVCVMWAYAPPFPSLATHLIPAAAATRGMANDLGIPSRLGLPRPRGALSLP